MINQLRRFLFITLCIPLVLCTACQPRQSAPPQVDTGEELAFETVEAVEDTEIGESRAYPDKGAAYFILWEHEDIAQVEEWISASAAAQLNTLDFSEYIAIAVFQGLKGTTGYNVVIERVGVRDGTLVLIAQFWQNPPNAPSGAVTTSPYHLVKIAKEDRISQQTRVEFHSYTQYHEIDVQ